MPDFDSFLTGLASSLDPTTATTAIDKGTDKVSSFMTSALQYGADSHNYGNGNWAITDPSTWAGAAGTSAGNALKMAAVSVASGVNGFYNTGVAVGNWFGAGLKENDVATQLSAVDDDLGSYYRQNRESADLAGFIVTSLVPGIGGVKLLNAGQKILRASETGMIGGNLARATGLLTPSVDAYRTLAAADIATSTATFSTTSANTIKAIRAGYGQAALESAAFEIAVAATTFKSPTLSDADGWDIAKNIVTGTVLGGAIGGALTHAATRGFIKRAIKEVNPAEKLFTDTADLVGLSESQKILTRQDFLTSMPAAPIAEDIASGAFKDAAGITKGLAGDDLSSVSNRLANKLGRLRETTQDTLTLANREGFNTLANGDAQLGNQLADIHQPMSGLDSFANMTHVEGFSRLNAKLPQELQLAAHSKEMQKLADKAVKEGIETVDASLVTPPPYKIGYLKLNGEGAGTVSFEAPTMQGLADTLPNRAAVVDKIKSAGFKEGKIFSSLDTTGGHLEAEARFQWADRFAVMSEGMRIGEHDIPLLEKARSSELNSITLVNAKGEASVLTTPKDIENQLYHAKETVTKQLLSDSVVGPVEGRLTTEMIGKITNVKPSWIEGEHQVLDPTADYFARQGEKEVYAKYLRDNKLPQAEAKIEDYGLNPTYAKAVYNTKQIMADGYEISGMAYMKAQQKLYQQGLDNAVANHIPEHLADQFVHFSDDMLRTSDRLGAGPSLVASANGGYNTLASAVEQVGSATSRLQKHFKDLTTDTLQSPLYKLAGNSNAAIEFEAMNKELQSTAHNYGINPEGTGIEPLDLLDYKAGLAAGKKNLTAPQFDEGTKMLIPFKNQETSDAWKLRTKLTGERTLAKTDIRNAQGLENSYDPRALRPIRPDPKDYPFFALVVDRNLTQNGHVSMIHAASARELDGLIAKVPPQWKTLTKDSGEQYHKALGDYDYSQTIHENYIDSSLKRSGVNNPFFMRTNPQDIVNNVLKDHLRSDDIFARELVNAKYEKEFSFLRQQGDQANAIATSKYTGNVQSLEGAVNNPYTNYVKTALNISQVSEHPLIMDVNTKLDKYVSIAHNTIRDAFAGAKSVADLDKVSAALEEFGVSTGYRDAATELLANHTAPKGVLTKFVGNANSILSTLVTRLDPFNAINNAIGATVLYGTETSSFLKSMKNADNETAAKLTGLLNTNTPLAESISPEGLARLAANGQSPDQMRTAGKLLVNAIKNFTDPKATTLSGELLKDFYTRNGWSTRLVDQFHSVMENITLVGTEDASVMSKKINAAFAGAKILADKGEKITGNKLAEEFNRFVAADTMRQMTDVGVAAGKITAEEQLSYINTFVNRTQGNILASQRPLMFQGPVGQAIGLFQTFQFNTMQQLFRHVSEGAPKDAAMMMGLQSTMYGMNGLPGFNFLNTHILGTMSGNPQHQDAYSATYGIAGKNIGDLVLYGLPSNMLRGNLYTRGDINPRSLTVVPSNPADIPFVAATTKLYTNVRDTVAKAANGGSVWEAMLQGIEHNGLSRPLAGFSQVTQALTHGGNVFSTTTKGNMSGANDLMSWATAVRLAGGKPLDESIATDTTFRLTSYEAQNRQRMDDLNKAIKSTVIGGSSPTGDQQDKFASEYAALGGKQKNFNKYMILQVKNANTVKANAIMENLKSPSNQRMQEIMGGTSSLDGNSM